jgi:hypothetical protein
MNTRRVERAAAALERTSMRKRTNKDRRQMRAGIALIAFAVLLAGWQIFHSTGAGSPQVLLGSLLQLQDQPLQIPQQPTDDAQILLGASDIYRCKGSDTYSVVSYREEPCEHRHGVPPDSGADASVQGGTTGSRRLVHGDVGAGRSLDLA